MLSQTKRIFYEHFNKTIFYFFTRTTADRHKRPGCFSTGDYTGYEMLTDRNEGQIGNGSSDSMGYPMDGEWGILCTSITSHVPVMLAN